MPSLDGQWTLARDPDNVGRQQRWYEAEAAPEAQPIHVPGIIQQAFPGYHGVAWYWCTFTAGPLPFAGGCYLLRFGTVDYLADVWVNGAYAGGHEGGETPFVLDETATVKPGVANLLAVRVLNPGHEPIDGFLLAETPHRNKVLPYVNGGSYDYGGITEPVELITAPAIWVEDLFVQPDWQTGRVRIQTNLRNTAAAALRARVQLHIAPATGSEVLDSQTLALDLAPGDTPLETELWVKAPHLWDLDDPYLYRVALRVETEPDDGFDERAVRIGFRDFRIANGYFRLNGRRIFVRSTHTGNHSPVGQILPPPSARDLLRRDLLYAKVAGYNMVRFISGVAHPYQLDLCDEIGLLVYEESLAGWLLQDSPKMGERFDRSVREMVLRDRNHPSVTVWGLLNETVDGPVFRHAVATLDLIRSLDPARLVLLSSGRWDCQLGIGSVSNPGSAAWEYEWGDENPGAAPAPYSWKLGYPGGYFERVGDAHVYPGTPHTPETVHFIRTLGQNTKPVFLSEYGIGSVMNALRELRMYEHREANPQAEDLVLMRSMAERFVADWTRFGMDGVYAFPEDMLRESQRLHCRQRLLGFDAIRSNPKICGFNLTGMLDHGMTGEGVWTFWREWKPGILDALVDGWAPVRWCLFVEPLHAYTGRQLNVEAVLANEDDLPPGDYPVTLRIHGPGGVAWEHRDTLSIPAPGEDAPLAVPVFRGAVTLAGPPGAYELAATIERGAAPAGGRLRFRLADMAALPQGPCRVVAWGLDEPVLAWLRSHQVSVEPFAAAPGQERRVILVGDVTATGAETGEWRELARRVAQGSTAVFLTPAALRRGENSVGWLPLRNKGRGYEFNDWLYHKECVAKAHPVFAGLQAPGIMDWDYYGPLIPRYLFDGQDTPDEVMAAAFALGYSCPGGYASGWLLGSYQFGAGLYVLNTFKVLENLGRHPAADRLLLNLVAFAAGQAQGAPASLPADFAAHLAAIGYG